jgi:hypothetical protein
VCAKEKRVGVVIKDGDGAIGVRVVEVEHDACVILEVAGVMRESVETL